MAYTYHGFVNYSRLSCHSCGRKMPQPKAPNNNCVSHLWQEIWYQLHTDPPTTMYVEKNQPSPLLKSM